MDVHSAPARGHIEHPHGTGEEEHHEKKPVMKKVKDKVKKIKDTMSKKRHGHGDDHEHHDVSEEDEGYEEDEEEREEDPGVHGAAVYESAAAEKIVTGKDENIGPERVSLGKITGAVEEDPAAPKKRSGTSATSDQNQLLYPSSAGGDEVGESHLVRSFQAMAVSDQPKGQQDSSPPTGSHNQFSPEKTTHPSSHDNPKETVEPIKNASYTDKITSTASAAKDAAVSAAVGSTEYGKKIASTVYDKVSEAGTAVMGKVQQQSGTTRTEGSDGKAGQVGQPDKGVSVKEYLVGKLRPGEEDRALSEVISEVIHMRKEGAVETPEVRESSEGSGGKGMVEKIKGAVRSLLGAGGIGGTRASPVTDTQMKEAKAAEGPHQQPEGQKPEEDIK